jgi:hypothetical protein
MCKHTQIGSAFLAKCVGPLVRDVIELPLMTSFEINERHLKTLGDDGERRQQIAVNRAHLERCCTYEKTFNGFIVAFLIVYICFVLFL